eukprot:SAG22_NODE_244_length_14023_cov_45.200661_6_plen_117_part_00
MSKTVPFLDVCLVQIYRNLVIDPLRSVCCGRIIEFTFGMMAGGCFETALGSLEEEGGNMAEDLGAMDNNEFLDSGLSDSDEDLVDEDLLDADAQGPPRSHLAARLQSEGLVNPYEV